MFWFSWCCIENDNDFERNEDRTTRFLKMNGWTDEIATDIPRVSLIETMWRGLFIFLLFFESQWFCVHCMVRLDVKLWILSKVKLIPLNVVNLSHLWLYTKKTNFLALCNLAKLMFWSILSFKSLRDWKVNILLSCSGER